jgi:SAM-dependent methyltransferase
MKVPIKSFIRNHLPRPLLPFAKSAYYAAFRATIRPRCSLIQLRETFDPSLRRKIYRAAGRQLPPPLMRYRIGEDTNPFRFLSIGHHLSEDLQHCLDLLGAHLSEFPRVLDFGCGCGRTLLHLMNRFPTHQFIGTDVDSEAISWCSRYLGPASFCANRPEPPLPLKNGSVDLIYGISVFTHLNKNHQKAWIPELNRVLRPGGALIISVNGETAAAHAGITSYDLRDLNKDGVVFLTCKKLSTIHPEWYQTSFNERAYTESAFSAYFTDIRYMAGIFGFQDAVVCKKPPTGGTL